MTLGEREVRFLSEIPHGSPSLDVDLECELECGHRGPHHSIGDTSHSFGAGRLANGEAVAWWVRWDDSTGRRDVVPMGNCPVETARGQVLSEVCILFDRHPGRHTFEWESPG